jgi:acyl carrier protein
VSKTNKIPGGSRLLGLRKSPRWRRIICSERHKHFVMENTDALKQDIRRLMVENLMLQIGPEEIGDEQPLFGPGSVGLDSVDALQLVVALDKHYGLKIADPEAARQILQSVKSIADAVVKHQVSGKP